MKKNISYSTASASEFKSTNRIEITGRLASDIAFNEAGTRGTLKLIHNMGGGKPAVSDFFVVFANSENPVPANVAKGAQVKITAYRRAVSWEAEGETRYGTQNIVTSVTVFEPAEKVDDTPEEVDPETGEISEQEASETVAAEQPKKKSGSRKSGK